MKLQAIEERSIPDYVEFEHHNLSFQEKQEKISKLLNNLKIGKLNSEQYLSLVENNKIIGLLRWRIGNLDGQKVVETLGSPSIALPEKRLEAMEMMIQLLLELSSKHQALTKLTLDEERIGYISPEFFLRFNLGLLFPRYTHIKQRQGGMFCGTVPEFRQKGLGRQVHHLGLERLKKMGALHYRGETFVGNTPMKSIFAANQCLFIPNSNYWEYQTISTPKT
jgi:predicted acetyltransferase